LGHAAVSQQTLNVANSAKEWTHIENDKKRSLLSTREEDDGTGMVGKKKDKDKIKNKPGAFCPTEGLDKHDEDSRSHLFDWGSKKQKSKLILTVPHGHNFPRLPGHFGFSTDVPDIFVKLNIQIGSDSYSARTSVERNTFDPEWNFICVFPIPKEAKDVTISGSVFDGNSNRQDTFLGNIVPISFPISTHYQRDVMLPWCGACTVNIGVKTKKPKPTEPPWLFIALCSAAVAGAILLCGGVYYVTASRPSDLKESPQVGWSGGGPQPAGQQQWAAPPGAAVGYSRGPQPAGQHWGPGPPAAQRAAAQWSPAAGR
jgi:hypothetical protein